MRYHLIVYPFPKLPYIHYIGNRLPEGFIAGTTLKQSDDYQELVELGRENCKKKAEVVAKQTLKYIDMYEVSNFQGKETRAEKDKRRLNEFTRLLKEKGDKYFRDYFKEPKVDFPNGGVFAKGSTEDVILGKGESVIQGQRIMHIISLPIRVGGLYKYNKDVVEVQGFKKDCVVGYAEGLGHTILIENEMFLAGINKAAKDTNVEYYFQEFKPTVKDQIGKVLKAKEDFADTPTDSPEFKQNHKAVIDSLKNMGESIEAFGEAIRDAAIVPELKEGDVYKLKDEHLGASKDSFVVESYPELVFIDDFFNDTNFLRLMSKECNDRHHWTSTKTEFLSLYTKYSEPNLDKEGNPTWLSDSEYAKSPHSLNTNYATYLISKGNVFESVIDRHKITIKSVYVLPSCVVINYVDELGINKKSNKETFRSLYAYYSNANLDPVTNLPTGLTNAEYQERYLDS